MANSVFTYLNSYCERAGEAGALAEPLNLFTNLFFIVAAVLAGRALLQVKAKGQRIDLWLLVLFLFAIGIGSGLWHLKPTATTVLMDVIPITLFINLYILSALRRLFKQSWAKMALWWGIYMGASVVAQVKLPPDLLNGSIMYIPAYLTLATMTAVLWKRDKIVGRGLVAALSVLTVSLTFRTIDMDACESFVTGTHFLWHTLNAWVLWRLLMLLVVKTRYTKGR